MNSAIHSDRGSIFLSDFIFSVHLKTTPLALCLQAAASLTDLLIWEEDSHSFVVSNLGVMSPF